MQAKNRALFLDRDGVINHDAGYTSKIEDFQFIDGIFELCREAKRLGYLIIVVTNQAGIGRGYYSEQDFLVLTEWMKARFIEEAAPITEVYFCPYHSEHGVGVYKQESFDRKPNPGMLLKAAESLQIDLRQSIMIGDKVSDMRAAKAACVKYRFYLTEKKLSVDIPDEATHFTSSLLDLIGLMDSVNID